MTLRDFFQLLRRRWYVFAGVLALIIVATVLMARDGGSYTTRTTVIFTLPAANVLTPESGADSESVITFAGVVAAQINEGLEASRYSKSDAPFYGAGVREGVLVGLRDEGNQWATRYSEAILDVQIVGRTYEWVAIKQRSILAEIEQIVASEQSGGVADGERIVAHTGPLTLRIEYISASRSAQVMAAAAMLVAAGLVGSWLAVSIDRRAQRRRARRARTRHAGAALREPRGTTA
ncbi:hypothetical protein [Microbacterium memoriense]|uniref:Polysaccharide chain length determinant N-terminal domain-containing protein n=1 Tax=Microbacterium memoriense TaxID=2978350 RepID=A0ABT2PDH7_9MICO|nr:hypothetical protein [Microbacterium memoriense]MCT9002631.1 hypothetical protein [Microbacterium memoriense]